MMNRNARVARICQILKKRYPKVETPLIYKTPFQLLVATILSAQCTDNQVNKTTRTLYQHLKTPEDWDRTCKECPGSGKGKLHQLSVIETQRKVMKI